MASTNNITNIYESYLEMSFINHRNFNGKITPSAIVGSFIPCFRVKEFYIDSLIYLHLYASLYYELINFIKTNNNDISLFKSCIDNLTIQIINGQNSKPGYTNIIGHLDYGSGSIDNRNKRVTKAEFKFSLTSFKNYYNDNTGTGYFEYYPTPSAEERYFILKPVVNNISAISSYTAPQTVVELYGLASGSTNTNIYYYSTTNTITTPTAIPSTHNDIKTIELGSYSPNYNAASRVNMLNKIIKDILSQGHANIMSYLLYYTIYYHLVVYNTCIQNDINNYYLHNIAAFNNSLTTKTALKTVFNDIAETGTGSSTSFAVDFSTAGANYRQNINTINSLIGHLTTNIGTLENTYLGAGSVEYTNNKTKYADKIGVLNDIKADYDRIQTELNITIKDYNKYIKNFQAVKTYANFIIMVLIIVIIITIAITVLDSITPNFKNYYYIIAFFILSFITFVYYNKFRYINLYERFTDIYNAYDYREASTSPPASGSTSNPVPNSNSSCISNTIDIGGETDVKKKNSHISFINALTDKLNLYIKATTNIMNGLRSNIYTANYGVFAKDGNNYLYNLYIDKKSQNEANRIKKVALANMLDTMKRHIVYLFNVILLISILTIILLLGLILFSNFPFYLNYIIILCVILIVIIIIYFINSIVQPTRMIVNKNYWANNNPSKYLIAKLA